MCIVHIQIRRSTFYRTFAWGYGKLLSIVNYHCKSPCPRKKFLRALLVTAIVFYTNRSVSLSLPDGYSKTFFDTENQSDDNRNRVFKPSARVTNARRAFLTRPLFTLVAEPTTEILGGPELYINQGSTINLTCLVQFAPEPPPTVGWTHEKQVSGERFTRSVFDDVY